MAKKEMPVYLFTGFLESGKTTFIQESLESGEFNPVGTTTLLLCCEEGEEEYSPDEFCSKEVYIVTFDEEKDLTGAKLEALEAKYKPDRVVVEYNGMWMLDTLYQNMPGNWITYQEMCFAHAPTFLTYNQNMRNLVFDKLQSAEMVIFNRFSQAFDKMAFHKIVRTANRKSQIIYEYQKDQVEFDNIEDPLPFDITKDEIVIDDKDYAYWYRDINEESLKYEDKKITFKGRTLVGGGLPKDSFVFGRHVMTCCVEDIQFAGLVCSWKPSEIEKLVHGNWAVATIKVKNEYHAAYQDEGPVLYVEKLEVCPGLKDDVATF